MAKRFFVLLLATVAFFGGFYAIRGKKTPKRPLAAITTNIPSLKLDVPTVELAPSPKRDAEPHFPTPFLTPRIAALIAVAAVLCAGAYLGLGKGSETARAAVAVRDESPATASLDAHLQSATLKVVSQSDVTAILTRSLVSVPPPEAPAQPTTPAPTPVVAAEVETPAPVAQPAAAPPPASADGLEAIICALPWPCQQAINVASCESGTDRYGRLDGNFATNGNNYGLFQINGIHASRWADFWDAWMDPAKNAQWAYEIYAQQGWRPWDCRWAAY